MACFRNNWFNKELVDKWKEPHIKHIVIYTTYMAIIILMRVNCDLYNEVFDLFPQMNKILALVYASASWASPLHSNSNISAQGILYIHRIWLFI